MIVERTLRVLVLLVAAGGCQPSSGDGNPPSDAAPIIMYERFVSTTWSLSTTGGAAQLSITDAAGPAACALSVDQHRSLGAAGVQIILQLPGMVTGTCPQGGYSINGKCAAALGSAAYVPAGCAFYRKWDAQGALVGLTAAINGEITIAGTPSSCTIRASVGFLGASFDEIFSLTNGATAQPWCMGS